MADTQGRTRRVLIVDDSTACSTALARLLTLLGHLARIAHDGPEGLEAASEFRPDLVLMDIGLPGMDGYEAARQLRDKPWGTGLTLVALTSCGQVLDVRRFREVGFDHHLSKPVGVDALVSLVGRS